jgi:hypothetical protein
MGMNVPLGVYDNPEFAAVLSLFPILWGLLLIRYRDWLNVMPGKVFHQFASEKTTGCFPVLLGIALILAGLICLGIALFDLCRGGSAATGT